MRVLGIGIYAFGIVAAKAQTVNLHGVVTSNAGKPLVGATVVLDGQDLKSTTDIDGSFALRRSVSLRASAGLDGMALEQGVLRWTVRSPEAVDIRVFDVAGHELGRKSMPHPSMGAYAWSLAEAFPSRGLLLVRVARAGETTVLRCLGLDSRGSGGRMGGGIPEGLARLEAGIDSLRVSASGYLTKSLPISSYEGTVDVSLEASSPGLPTPAPSAGCGKDLGSLKAGNNPLKITSSNLSRDYTINIPANYNKNNPHRLVFTWHWINASDDAVVNGQVSPGGGANWAYFGLKRMSDSAGVPTIFIAPSSRNGTWDQVDHVLFDDLLKLYKTSLCIDTGRVFATGFSFGAMQTNSLSLGKQKDLRAVATLAAANYNIYLPTNTHGKIAYLGMTGMSDGTCPFINNASAKTGGLFAAITHAVDNGCTVPTNPTKENPGIKTTTVGSKSHVVYDFPNCAQGYPVKYITFDGGHIAAPADGGNSDNGTTTWAPRETWKFFMQF